MFKLLLLGSLGNCHIPSPGRSQGSSRVVLFLLHVGRRREKVFLQDFMCGNISDRRSIWEGQLTEPKRRLEVSPAALSWRFSKSSGPGGQHVNTSDSRVELICDLSQITAERAVLERITQRFGNELRVVVSSQRSQLQNRRMAMEKLIEQLEKAAEVPRNRRATRPTWSSVQSRLDNKRHTSSRKAARRSTFEE